MKGFNTALVLIAMAPWAVAQTSTPVTLVNPGFEAPYVNVNHAAGVTTITGQVANGWNDNSSQSNATVQYSQETSNPHGGTSCQKIVVANPGTTGNMLMFFTLGFQNGFPIRPGNIYTASVWMRGPPGPVGSIYVSQRALLTKPSSKTMWT